MFHALRSASLATLSTLLLVSPSATAQNSRFEGQVEVMRGRAVLHEENGSKRLLGTREQFRTPDQAHLELGAGAELRLSWPGLASLRVWGPASLDWQPWKPSIQVPGREPGLAWRVTEMAWADLEVRRGVHRLELPGDWSARIEQSALHLRSLPWGPIEVRHHAGQVLQMLWSGDPHHVRPPLTIYPGSSLRLDQPPEGAEDVSRHARAWDMPTWPWSRRTDRPGEAEERRHLAELGELQRRGPAAWPRSEGARERTGEFHDRENLDTELLGGDPEGSGQPAQRPELNEAPTPQPWSRQAPPALPAQPAPETAPDPDPEREAPEAEPESATDSSLPAESSRTTRIERLPEPKPDAQARQKDERSTPSIPDDSKRWRGVQASQRIPAGRVWVQKSAGVEVRASSGTRWKVLVDRSAKSGIWCFAPKKDFFMKPGSIAVFDSEGGMETSYGSIQGHPAAAAAPE